MAERRGGDLFIVDNSVDGWTGLRYLQEWCDLAKSFDIATGFFEIGSLLALNQKWQSLEKSQNPNGWRRHSCHQEDVA